ncbi:2-oxoglutarate dehydrogenase complex dihydrolipoyllysine-residue succinyltransferase [Porticoccus litoralis]|jgi:2-oxoglutarate dehydrogenase E2 component (dihydrolipoamide succinyltransferase)|uniref:Dihydrolipoyllysine-residue succinyltransferase component of 2-oxoglutarate dehydrogenase complex n=1 Tax=Porticoccus litoralis TaxID=434086 RepID=A0AAW8B4J3_9GAMM|nr:2-oxoglutarate dehydrogenase complex dihydrolipoyllysine-residue succinyltransferase [Porticoccus litoralis]MDP1521370.1 2-oxoglutarate dehydrogenase complex dihydrolipoyllysine-residue succinyltransferase [Porticoccus litoralis]
MSIEIKAPTFPESVQEGNIATWHKQPGDTVVRDELLVDIETDKVVLEVVAPADGTLQEVFKGEGDVVLSNEVIAKVVAGAVESASAAAPAAAAEEASTDDEAGGDTIASPAARKLAEEKGIDLQQVTGTGKDGRITKEDVVGWQAPAVPSTPPAAPAPAQPVQEAVAVAAGERVEKRVPMTRMRSRIADRLLQVTQTTAMLTTFNEVDMHRIMALRSEFKDTFTKVHNGTRLGFMGFFVKAATEALKRFPSVNASIDGNDIVYHGYQDVGVAVSTDKGLVVPVLRDADNMGIAEIESTIAEFGGKARDGKLTIEDMTGGTFTITNGGVFGSLLSTPILNPPQTAILGMHKIQERPVAENGQVVVRPMMYLALSYDHRLIDGKEAVQFLVAIKEMIENPAKILLEI